MAKSQLAAVTPPIPAPTPQIVTTLGVLADAEATLQAITTMELAPKVRYHAAKLARLVSAATKAFHDERTAAFQAYSVERPSRPHEVEKNGLMTREIPLGTVGHTKFTERMKPVYDDPVTIPWGPLRSGDLPKATAKQLLDLGPLCELVEPEE